MSAASTSVSIDIKSLCDRMVVDGVYSLINPQLGTTRQGKPFLKCILRDASGEMPGRMWSCDEQLFGRLSTSAFVRVRGRTEMYNTSIQLMIDSIDPVEPSPDELARLVPTTRFDIDEMFAEVSALLRSLQHPGMLALGEAFLNDEARMRRFRRAPAAASVHHAYIGGLIEHTLQLMKLADRMLPLYSQSQGGVPGERLNRDLVMMGLFLHDLGKTVELEWERGFNYTFRGNLIGHVVDGVLLVRAKFGEVRASGAAEIPPRAQTVLEHIVASHHEKLEFGAAKMPSTPEAVFVALLDNLDAKTSMALAHVRRGEYGTETDLGGEFTEKIWALEGNRLYRPDPLRQES
ncbi:MAG: HD domain-containing protein [Phycisphaerae bacterium]|nr:HD domain-containing protein [Phycisphaerae bacterium]